MGEDEEREEGEEKERVVKMAAVSPLYRGKHKSKRKMKTVQVVNNSYDSVLSLIFFHTILPGKRHRRKKKTPEVAVVSLDVSDAEKEVPANPGE